MSDSLEQLKREAIDAWEDEDLVIADTLKKEAEEKIDAVMMEAFDTNDQVMKDYVLMKMAIKDRATLAEQHRMEDKVANSYMEGMLKGVEAERKRCAEIARETMCVNNPDCHTDIATAIEREMEGTE